MRKLTKGPVLKERVWCFVEALLSRAEGLPNFEVHWEDEDTNRPKLVVKTRRRFLEGLTQIKQSQVYEVINSLKELKILEDRRFKQKRGSDQWCFALKLWSRDAQRNREQFERVWEGSRTDKSRALEATFKESEKTASTQTPNARLLPTPYENLGRRGVNPEQFIGREEKLKKLHELLQQNSQVAITAAVVGMGGVGKTELAIQYARKHLHAYQGGVCWLPATDWKTQLVKFARRYLGLNPPPYLDGDLPGQVAYCWQYWCEGEVLLVLDDVTDYSLLAKEDLPGNSRFKVLMTTREALDTPVVPLNLDVLEPDDALKLLKSLVKKSPERFGEEPVFATRLCEWLEHLPLGLELVGRYLHLEPDLSLSEMLFQLQQQALKHESMERDEVDLQKAMTAERGVEAAFELTWKRLDDKSKHLGKMLSLFALAPIPWEYVELTEKYYSNLFQQGEGFQSGTLKKARRKLIYFHLLKDIGQQTFLLHSLIRKFFQSKREELNDTVS